MQRRHAARAVIDQMLVVSALMLTLSPGFRPVCAAPLAEIQADTCFSGMTGHGPLPVVIVVTNNGPSVDGAVVVRSESYSGLERDYLYPISLPTGAQKRVFAYPNVAQDTDKITIGFDGHAKMREVTLPVSAGADGQQQVGFIGDRIGGLSGLRGKAEPGLPGGYVDAYARPEDAPDRASGDRSLSTLMLGDGAERMDGAQWSAIREWVIDGGSLILLGGASGAYLRLPDAQDLVPLTQLRGIGLSGIDTPGAGVPPGPVALTTGVPKPGATVVWRQGNMPLLATERLGAGKVLYVAYDPLDAPFRGWGRQTTLWTQLIQKAQAPLGPEALSSWASQSNQSSDEGMTTTKTVHMAGGKTVTTSVTHLRGMTTTTTVELSPGGSTSSSTTSYYSAPGPPDSFDAFHVQLPPVSSIAWMLLAYFVAVIPITYFVLKKARRLEWAWLTTPLLSIVFAYGFYLFTADLYKAGLSRRTAGILTAAAGDSSARFSGETEMFFPRGGDYALAIPDAESLETTNVDTTYGSGGATDLQPLETIDTGAVAAPHYGTTNLNFKRIFFTQPLAWGIGVNADLRRDAKGEVTGRVINQTDLPLRSIDVVFPGTRRYATLPDLPPGKSATITMMPAVAYTTGDLTDWQNFVHSLPTDASENTALLLARTDGNGFGPNLGRDVGAAGSVHVLVSVPVR